MIGSELIRSQIKSIKAQLRVLKASVQYSSALPVLSGTPFDNLYGSLRNEVESSEEEIDSVLYGNQIG